MVLMSDSFVRVGEGMGEVKERPSLHTMKLNSYRDRG